MPSTTAPPPARPAQRPRLLLAATLLLAVAPLLATAPLPTRHKCATGDCEPTITKARLRAVPGGEKLKLSYTLHHAEGVEHQLCFGCTIRDGAEQPADASRITKGGTCGGHPSGCGVLKGAGFVWGEKVSVAFRLQEPDGSWSGWSQPTAAYHLDPALKAKDGGGNMHVLEAEPIAEGGHEDL